MIRARALDASAVETAACSAVWFLRHRIVNENIMMKAEKRRGMGAFGDNPQASETIPAAKKNAPAEAGALSS